MPIVKPQHIDTNAAPKFNKLVNITLTRNDNTAAAIKPTTINPI